MSAFVIVHVKVKDPEKFQAYAKSAPATVAAHGGRFILRGRLAEVFAGAHDRPNVVVIQFPDQAAAKGWYESPAYQALIPNRDAAAEMTFLSYDEPPAP